MMDICKYGLECETCTDLKSSIFKNSLVRKGFKLKFVLKQLPTIDPNILQCLQFNHLPFICLKSISMWHYLLKEQTIED